MRVLEQVCRLSHVSVRLSVCPAGELWTNGWLDSDAVWGGESREWGRLRHWCITRVSSAPRGRRGFRFFSVPLVWMAFLSVFLKQKSLFDSSVKSWSYFRAYNISVETLFILLS